ncbi:hypothetical protein OC845_002927 [Tilletia horrida]|nr:hypothetical protein OC845_002927 [Tilletia horrida]
MAPPQQPTQHLEPLASSSTEPTLVRRKSSIALTSLQERLHSGPRIRPTLKIAILPSTAGVDSSSYAYAETGSMLSPKNRLGLTLGQDYKDSRPGVTVSPTGFFSSASLRSALDVRRQSAASITSSSSNESSSCSSNGHSLTFSSVVSLPMLEYSSGTRTPSYLSPTSRSRTLDKAANDTVIDHLPSSEIAARRVSSFEYHTSATDAPGGGELAQKSEPRSRSISSMTTSTSDHTRLSAAALAELESETHHLKVESMSHSKSNICSDAGTVQARLTADVINRLRPQSSGGDSVTSCGTVRPGQKPGRFHNTKHPKLNRFAVLKNTARASIEDSHETDAEAGTDADVGSDAGTETPVISPTGTLFHLRNPFDMYRQSSTASTTSLDPRLPPPAPRIQAQHPLMKGDAVADSRGRGKDDDAIEELDDEHADGSSGSSESDEEDSDDDVLRFDAKSKHRQEQQQQQQQRNTREQQPPKRRHSILRRSAPSALDLPATGIAGGEMGLDVPAWDHGQVERAWRAAAQKREARFQKRSTVCGVVEFEVDTEDDGEEEGDGSAEAGRSPATPCSILSQAAAAAAAAAEVRMQEAAISARVSPRPETWSPARFASYGIKQNQEYSTSASRRALLSGAVSGYDQQQLAGLAPPSRPEKSKLRSNGSSASAHITSIPAVGKPDSNGDSSRSARSSASEATHSGSSLSPHAPFSATGPAAPRRPSITFGNGSFSRSVPTGNGRRVSVTMPVCVHSPGAVLLGNGTAVAGTGTSPAAMLSPSIANATITAAVAAVAEAAAATTMPTTPGGGNGENPYFCNFQRASQSFGALADADVAAAAIAGARRGPCAREAGGAGVLPASDEGARRRSSGFKITMSNFPPLSKEAGGHGSVASGHRRSSSNSSYMRFHGRRPPSPPLGTSPVEEPALNNLLAMLAGKENGLGPVTEAYGPGAAVSSGGVLGMMAAPTAAAAAARARHSSLSGVSGAAFPGATTTATTTGSRSRAPSLADTSLNNGARHSFIVDATSGAIPS